MVDRTLMLRKLSLLDQYLGQIREFTHLTVQEYNSDWKVQRVVERTLQLMIETCLDVTGHIISDEGWRVPNTYADMFLILVENNLLERGRLENLQKMAQFRNLVVHDYGRIDPEIVIGILQNKLPDFEAFKEKIIAYLSDRQGNSDN